MKCVGEGRACIICLAVLSSLLNLMRGGTSGAADAFSGADPEDEKFLVCRLNAKEAN